MGSSRSSYSSRNPSLNLPLAHATRITRNEYLCYIAVLRKCFREVLLGELKHDVADERRGLSCARPSLAFIAYRMQVNTLPLTFFSAACCGGVYYFSGNAREGRLLYRLLDVGFSACDGLLKQSQQSGNYLFLGGL